MNLKSTNLITILVSLLFPNILSVLHSTLFLKLELSLIHFAMPTVAGAGFAVSLIFLMNLKRIISKKKEELEKIIEDINSFTGMIVHELKTPVSGIYSIIELIKEREIIETKDELINLIRISSQNMLGNIDEILKLNKHHRTEEKNIIYKNPKEDLIKYITFYKKKAEQSQIKIHEDFKEICKVSYNPDLLQDVMANLIGNAIKYSFSDSNIYIKMKRIKNFLKIMICDEGQGMSEKDLGVVFSKFQKLSATPTNGESSTGLGLWIVKKLISRMGGEAGVNSQGKNKGSTFWITLPTRNKT